MAKFKWHADYFDGTDSTRSVRRALIDADNAGRAESIARAQLGRCSRVEVRRLGTAAPVRVIHARQGFLQAFAPMEKVIALMDATQPAPAAG